MTASLYNNDNYEVFFDNARTLTIEGNEFSGVYVVKNIRTAAVEYVSPSLPECLHVAAQWDIALTKEVHLWPYKRDERAESGHAEMLASTPGSLVQ